MSLLLCRQEQVENPYFVEELGVHIYSSQELCYIIYNNPLLVMDDFFDDLLTGFIRTELRMPFLAEKIEKIGEDHGSTDEILFQILADVAYYSPQEQAAFRQKVMALRRLAPAEYQKEKADFFYKLGLYGRAVAIYGKILDDDRELKLSGEFRAKICNNEASSYARLFDYKSAMDAYDAAYCEDEKEEYLKRMYFLTKVKPELSMKERYETLVTDEIRQVWDEEYETLLADTDDNAELLKIDGIFDKDPIKRISQAGELIAEWKEKYRQMA